MSKKNKRNKQKQKVTSPVTQITVHKPTGEVTHIAEDEKGKLVLTKEDKANLDKVKKLQAKALQAKIDAKEALAKAQDAVKALDGSDAIKAIKQDIEARLKAQEDVVKKVREQKEAIEQTLKSEIGKLQDIQSEYKALTGIDKRAKAIKSKGKSTKANGRFETKPITVDSDGSLKVLVVHKETKSLFEYSLYPSNGKIKREDWLKLRHSLTAQFERDTKEDDLTIRAYLSNLKNKIEAKKAIV